MKLKLCLVICLLYIFNIANSQSKIGSWIAISQSEFKDERRPERFDPILTYSLGITIESELSQYFSIISEFDFDQRGSLNTFNSQIIKLNYLGIYLGMKYNLFSGANSLAFGINGSLLLDGSIPVKNSFSDAYFLKNYDFSLWAGFRQYIFFNKNSIFLELRYNHGLVNIDGIGYPLSPGSRWTKNRILQLGIGFLFHNINRHPDKSVI